MKNFRFSLRNLLLAVAVCGSIGGWVGPNLWTVYQRKATINCVEKIGGDCIGSYYPEGETWIRRQLGDQSVIEIDLPIGTELGDARRIAARFPEASVFIMPDTHLRTGSHLYPPYPAGWPRRVMP
jgi:hypothetical protein